MGTTLLGTQINNTYPGLLKTADNAVLGATEKIMGDGLGNDSTLSLGTASASFTGTLDLSGATVTGLPGGAPGLVAGVGTDSMKSADSLTGTPASAGGTNSIALGENVNVSGLEAVGIGTTVTSSGARGVGIGFQVSNQGSASIAIGRYAANPSVASASVTVGADSTCQFTSSVAIGFTTKSFANNGVAIGRLAKVEPFGGSNSIAIGNTALSQANGAVAIGANVTAQKSDTVTVKKLETLDPGEGIIMHSPNGTEYKVTVSDAGALVVTAV